MIPSETITEYKKVTFVLENDIIRPQRYEENKEAMAEAEAAGLKIGSGE